MTFCIGRVDLKNSKLVDVNIVNTGDFAIENVEISRSSDSNSTFTLNSELSVGFP